MSQAPSIWHQFWTLKMPTKAKIFIWMLMNQILIVKVFLKHIILGLEVKCPLCRLEEESQVHLFWSCPFSKKIWDNMRDWWKINLDIEPIKSSLLPVMLCMDIHPGNRDIWMIMVCLVWWNIWKTRNILIFQGLYTDH